MKRDIPVPAVWLCIALTIVATNACADPRRPVVQGGTCRVTASIQQVVSLSSSSRECEILIRRPGRYAVCVSELAYRSNGALRLKLVPRSLRDTNPKGGKPVSFHYAVVEPGQSPDRAVWRPAAPGNATLVAPPTDRGPGEGQTAQLWLGIESTEATPAGEFGCEITLEVTLRDHYDAVVP